LIGIYQDGFLDYLKDRLGSGRVKTSAKNIICSCPWCEYETDKKHYHLYISLEAPIFHCFRASCEQKGMLHKFLKRLEGKDISNEFIDKDKLQEFQKKNKVFTETKKQKKIYIPELDTEKFKLKDFYIKKRLKFSNILSTTIKGLIYDVDEFINKNNIPVDETLFRLRDYLQNNFVGFLTEHEHTVVFRNIDSSQDMRYFKLKIGNTYFLDYYKLPGNNPNSNKIVIAEGIFDIFSEQIFDNLNIKQDVALYASALSSKYLSLIHSIIFHEEIFKPEVIILSDRGVEKEHYQKLKYYNKGIIDKMSVYYNLAGKDFNDTPVVPQKYVY
jgi:hypothetical protein